ncbi:hypothetical protein C8A01DRAFT_45466 [Parachaetomium inaequale]|uniref:Uncharacterized protein n=1 Tax=Parachaetomium inaequale TaxID=2588326 RepID=A0AAN6SSZ0_9PEZI|nr:hypothetical protein C8A01DRAFT_45466 [Parachaetomium inaequale]
MADPDQSISNGTCFWAPGIESDPRFIPCGNAAFGNIHCCQAGDYCLADGACYNDRWGTTYLAGCTDLFYQDASCPDKQSYNDQPWAGLIYCRPNRWVVCEERSRPATITKPDQCTCPPDESMTVAFTEASVIPGMGLLPTTSGGTIEWQPGYLPTAVPSRSSSSSSAESETTTTDPTSPATSSPTLALSTPTFPPSNNSTPGNGLSDAAKAGIGTGAAVGAILLFGALSALWVVLRRRRNDKNSLKNSNNDPSSPETETGPGPVVLLPQTQSDKYPPGPAEMPTPDVPPWPAFTELPGSGGGGGVGPWVVRPELQGDGGSVMPGGAYGGYHGQVSPLGSPSLQTAGGWQGRQSGGVPVPVPVLSAAVGEEGLVSHHQQGYDNMAQGYGQWALTGEGKGMGQGGASELPA